MRPETDPPPGWKPLSACQRATAWLAAPAALALLAGWCLLEAVVTSLVDLAVGWLFGVLLRWWWVSLGVILVLALLGYVVVSLSPAPKPPDDPPPPQEPPCPPSACSPGVIGVGAPPPSG